MAFDAKKVHRAVRQIPLRFKGPGGAVAVLKDGKLVDQHVWGYADLSRRVLMTDQVQMPICSITKQLLCLLMIDLAQNPTLTISKGEGGFLEQMSTKLKELLPSEVTHDSGILLEHLCDMCSGLRDYWALCTLWGSKPDSAYSIQKDNAAMLHRLKSFHFTPGTEFSYANTNFNILGRLVEQVSQESLAHLLAERVFRPAQMTTAYLCPRTDQLPGPCVGYEGTDRTGFLACSNFIEWAGDAGAVASLADMIAYEQYFDRKYCDPRDDYRSIVEPHKYSDGTKSLYRYGLGHPNVGNLATVGHGGALRGYRLHRRYVQDERISVVVMFNHEAEAQRAAEDLIKEIMNISNPPKTPVEPSPAWFGYFFDQDTQLVVTVKPGDKGKVTVAGSWESQTLELTDANSAECPEMAATIEGDLLKILSLECNHTLNAKRIEEPTDDVVNLDAQGTYRCDEIDSTFVCQGENGMLYGTFDGFIGKGPPHLMIHLGGDVWFLRDPRGMDAPAPGDWTLSFHRDGQGEVASVTIGCWLARKLEFNKHRH